MTQPCFVYATYLSHNYGDLISAVQVVGIPYIQHLDDKSTRSYTDVCRIVYTISRNIPIVEQDAQKS